MNRNYPDGVTGMEPEIMGAYEYGMEEKYMTEYLARIVETIAGIRAEIADLELIGESTKDLEYILENNYVIKDGLEMSLQDIAWQKANL